MDDEPIPEGDDPLSLAAETGRRVLEAGGETYRAEETVTSLCRAWNCRDVECFATPTGLIASVSGKRSSQAVVRRISRRAVDLRRIARLSELVARCAAGGIGPEKFRMRLVELEREKPYRPAVILPTVGACAACFTLMFNGRPADAAAAFFVGIGIKAIAILSARQGFPDFIVNISGGAAAAGLTALAQLAWPGLNMDKVVIGSIMLLVPGLATVNAIRDMIAGDLVAGLARFVDAFIAALALSLGTGFTLTLVKAVERIMA